jgi:hypothetical protein
VTRIPAVPAVLATAVLALALGAVAPASASAAAPETPTDVTVAWEAVTPPPYDWNSPPIRAVRVTWTDATPVANKVCQDGYASNCITTTADEPDSVLMSIDAIAESAATRIAVVALGDPVSEPGLSPVFDSQRASDPVVTEVRPTSTGDLVLSWSPGAPINDVTPGDPLDLEPAPEHVYRVGAVDAEWTMWGPMQTATTATRVAPRGGLWAVTEVNEWNIRRRISIDPPVINVWMTDTVASQDRRVLDRGTLVVRGQVLSNAWWCYGSPPNCASDDGPGSPNATRPSASRTVQLQVRRSPTSAWSTLATTTTGADGSYRFSTRSVGTRQHRVLALALALPQIPKAADATTTWTVESYQRLRAATLSRTTAPSGSRVTASVRIGDHCVSRASLQRRTASGAWVTVQKARLVAGRASTSVSVRPGTTRYRWKVASCTAPGGLPVAGDTTGSMKLRGR